MQHAATAALGLVVFVALVASMVLAVCWLTPICTAHALLSFWRVVT